jgi:hypothetical protein
MWTPATAVLWEAWRITWRRVAFFAVLAIAIGAALLSYMGDRVVEGGGTFVVFMLLLGVAVLLLLSLVTESTRTGFPFSSGFARPIRTVVLVGIPGAYVCGVAAAGYLVPAGILRAVFGAPFPLASVAVLLAMSGAVLLAGMWFTRDRALRFAATIGAYSVCGAMLWWLRPFDSDFSTFPPPLSTELVALTPIGYLLVALLAVSACGVATLGVQRQRSGEDRPLFERSGDAGRPGRSADIIELVRNPLLKVLRWPCPTSSEGFQLDGCFCMTFGLFKFTFHTGQIIDRISNVPLSILRIKCYGF